MKKTLELLIAHRLTDLGNQAASLRKKGREHDARLLIREGMLLAESHDSGEDFLVLNLSNTTK